MVAASRYYYLINLGKWLVSNHDEKSLILWKEPSKQSNETVEITGTGQICMGIEYMIKVVF